jgi:hypothetical protein
LLDLKTSFQQLLAVLKQVKALYAARSLLFDDEHFQTLQRMEQEEDYSSNTLSDYVQALQEVEKKLQSNIAERQIYMEEMPDITPLIDADLEFLRDLEKRKEVLKLLQERVQQIILPKFNHLENESESVLDEKNCLDPEKLEEIVAEKQLPVPDFFFQPTKKTLPLNKPRKVYLEDFGECPHASNLTAEIDFKQYAKLNEYVSLAGEALAEGRVASGNLNFSLDMFVKHDHRNLNQFHKQNQGEQDIKAINQNEVSDL